MTRTHCRWDVQVAEHDRRVEAAPAERQRGMDIQQEQVDTHRRHGEREHQADEHHCLDDVGLTTTTTHVYQPLLLLLLGR